MYKIFINDRLLQLIPQSDSVNGAELVLSLSGSEQAEQLEMLVDAFEKNPLTETLFLTTPAIDKSWSTLLSIFQTIEAAGGVVFNTDHRLLMIFRNGKWDLPKGKIEPREDPETAAVREVYEECGIGELKLVKQLSTTYHTYTFQGRRTIKKTYWYLMTTTDTSKPVPQLEEGIQEVKWMKNLEVRSALKNSFGSIVTLLNEHVMSIEGSLLG